MMPSFKVVTGRMGLALQGADTKMGLTMQGFLGKMPMGGVGRQSGGTTRL